MRSGSELQLLCAELELNRISNFQWWLIPRLSLIPWSHSICADLPKSLCFITKSQNSINTFQVRVCTADEKYNCVTCTRSVDFILWRFYGKEACLKPLISAALLTFRTVVYRTWVRHTIQAPANPLIWLRIIVFNEPETCEVFSIIGEWGDIFIVA